ncbi:IS200/IS605 family transposase [Marinilabilia salmonicolor]|uniref:IS200/IS605 family transposase n=1 Tax=Marinilabilia salmonicolor TaxID=989 RepID=UPI0002F76C21|nr:IS200/IS605 family transposase [Marinilabilia salmonicolor]
MANTYHQMYVQAVFAVKYRDAILEKKWREDFFGVMGNLINETGCKNIIVNGVEDHVHCFIGLKPTWSVSDLMKIVKAKSSKWLNGTNYLNRRFEWQTGFGCFTYNQSHIHRVYRYIQNQEEHHRKKQFLKEYTQLLKAFKIDYDPRYIFDELK